MPQSWSRSVAGVFSRGLRECFEDGAGVAGELLAGGAQDDCPVRAGAQERDPGDGFELADLAGQVGVPVQPRDLVSRRAEATARGLSGHGRGARVIDGHGFQEQRGFGGHAATDFARDIPAGITRADSGPS